MGRRALRSRAWPCMGTHLWDAEAEALSFYRFLLSMHSISTWAFVLALRLGNYPRSIDYRLA